MTFEIKDTSTPVVVVNAKLATLGIMRSLGPLGVKVYAVDNTHNMSAFKSKYCSGAFVFSDMYDSPENFVTALRHVAKEVGGRPILVATSDETVELVAENNRELASLYIFHQTPPDVIKDLTSKARMYYLAKTHDVPVPETEFPVDIEDVMAYADRAKFPVMLKGIYGNRLMERTGLKMYIARDRDDLIETFKRINEPGRPNLMLQEYIPGDDDQVYIFNGYFNADSECLASFTGRKIRQFPVHTGCASMGACEWNSVVAEQTELLMKKIGYKGILDIGYRYDSRDWKYKVLDINPRIGQAFRLFVADNGLDVMRAMYLDMTGQSIPETIQREGRRWIIEDFDIISTYHYYQEGSLSFPEWFRSFRGLEEGAWFCSKDLRPFLHMLNEIARRATNRSYTILKRRLSIL